MTRCRPHRAGRPDEGSQSLIEFVAGIAVFGSLLLGILQTVLPYRAKSTVDYAAFMVAHADSLAGATQASVDDGFVRASRHCMRPRSMPAGWSWPWPRPGWRCV